MKIKQTLAEKCPGFYVMLAAAILAIVTAIAYAVSYSTLTQYLSWSAVVLLIGGAIVAVVLAFTNLDELGTGILALCSLIAMLMYVKLIYYYVSVVIVGIDVQSFDMAFITSAVLFVLTFVVSVVAIFVPKTKEQEEY